MSFLAHFIPPLSVPRQVPIRNLLLMPPETELVWQGMGLEAGEQIFEDIGLPATTRIRLDFKVIDVFQPDPFTLEPDDLSDNNNYADLFAAGELAQWPVPVVSDNLLPKLNPGNSRGKYYLEDQNARAKAAQAPAGKEAEEAVQQTANLKAANRPNDEFDLIYPLLLPPLGFNEHEFKSLPHPLHPYQWKGVTSLVENRSFLLADEMGTGKTVMTCVALKAMFQRGVLHSALIVCPKSVVSVWMKHLEEWAPELRVRVIRAEDDRKVFWKRSAHVFVTSIDTLRNDIENKSLQKGKPYFDLIIVDEAQIIKNYESKRSQAARKVNSLYRWAITGTPLENKTEDVVAILAFLFPAKIRGEHLRSFNEQMVKEFLKTCMLRRLKRDVLKDLPPIVRQELWLDMDAAQLKAYADLYEIEVSKLQQLQFGDGDFKIKSAAIQAIQRLKQICNFAPGHATSPKLEAIGDILAEIEYSDQKLVVFSQYIKEGLDKMQAGLHKHPGISFFKGSMSDTQRDQVLNDFRNNPAQKALFVSLRAGGSGITLTEASYVVMFDPWWNPAVMRQAEDRVHRIGQKAERVTVYQLAMTGTIEERIYKLLEQKRRLAATVVDSLADESRDLEQTLSTGELLSLFNLGFGSNGEVVNRAAPVARAAPVQLRLPEKAGGPGRRLKKDGGNNA